MESGLGIVPILRSPYHSVITRYGVETSGADRSRYCVVAALDRTSEITSRDSVAKTPMPSHCITPN